MMKDVPELFVCRLIHNFGAALSCSRIAGFGFLTG